MANLKNKLIVVTPAVHSLVRELKIIPKEPFGDCLARILEEYVEMKAKQVEMNGVNQI